MPEFVNTIDRVGDDVLTDSIILRNITEFNDNVITVVGDSAFYKCTALTSVDLPSVVSVGSDAFFGCSALVEAHLPVATVLGRSFDGCSALTNIYIPSVTSIGEQCFRACTSLTCVDLPAVSEMNYYVFYNATALTAVALRRTAGVATLPDASAFTGTPIASKTGYIYVPSVLLNSYKTATNWSIYADQFRKLEDWTVDGTVTGELDVDNRCMVRFFNDDGTLLGYKVVTTGSDAVYDGDDPVCTEDASWPFEGFAPAPTNVTADMDCYAQYAEPITLESASWARISEISAAGTGANYFSVGETKSITLKGTVGTLSLNGTYYVRILGFNHNQAVEGTGISFGCFSTADNKNICLVDSKYEAYVGNSTTLYFTFNHNSNANLGGWAGCDLRYDILGSTNVKPSEYLITKTASNVGYDATSTCATDPVPNTLMSCLPADLRAVMKPITKWTDNAGDNSNTESNVTASVDYLPLMSYYELYGKAFVYQNTYETAKQAQYAYYRSSSSTAIKKKTKHNATSTGAVYWTRTKYVQYGNGMILINTYADGNESSSGSPRGIAPVFMV